jgi:uncharacterized protein YjbI with pentapeptide repeats
VLFLERSFAKEAERRDLLLQLGIVSELRGIDLSGRDLSGFHLSNKDLRHANFRRANLRGANLSGAKLNHADLREADLRGTKLDETGLYPSETLVPSEDLAIGPIFPDANLQGAKLQGVARNLQTRLPQTLGPEIVDTDGAEQVNTLFQLFKWRWRHRMRKPKNP